MPHGNAEAQGVFGQRNGVSEVQRFDETLSQRHVPDLTSQHLYQPAGDHEARVAIRQRRAERMDLHNVRALTDVPGHAVIPATGVSEHVTVDPAGVRKQMLDSDTGGDDGVRHPELRQDLHSRRMELSPVSKR